jgi:hypothetical protein
MLQMDVTNNNTNAPAFSMKFDMFMGHMASHSTTHASYGCTIVWKNRGRIIRISRRRDPGCSFAALVVSCACRHVNIYI